MSADRQNWDIWTNALRRWGLHNLVATLLEALGPLTVLGAQVVYLLQPLLNNLVPQSQLETLANLLEDPIQTHAFASLLREGSPLWTS